MLHHLKKKSFYQKGAFVLLIGIVAFGNPSTPGWTGVRQSLPSWLPSTNAQKCNLKNNFLDVVRGIDQKNAIPDTYKKAKCPWAQNLGAASGPIADLVTGITPGLQERQRNNFCSLFKKSKNLQKFLQDNKERIELKCGFPSSTP